MTSRPAVDRDGRAHHTITGTPPTGAVPFFFPLLQV